jgi:DNA-binding HxlR family transcriptional regulator
MRTYGEYCAAAKALDVVGDRWTLLVVRELLIRDGLRYTDLQGGLPNIASNLLAERLRELEAAGVVWREAAPPPIATTLYHLTARGLALRSVIMALAAWGGPLLAQASDDDLFLAHWLTLPAESLLHDRKPDGPPVAIELRTQAGSVTVEADGGNVRSRPGTPDRADVVVEGSHRPIVRLMAGRIDPAEASASGLSIEGDLAVLRRLLPDPVPRQAQPT